eukprot:5420143-Prymnesium_polylepis.1
MLRPLTLADASNGLKAGRKGSLAKGCPPVGLSACSEVHPLEYSPKEFEITEVEQMVAAGIQPEDISMLSRLRIPKVIEFVSSGSGAVCAFGSSVHRRKNVTRELASAVRADVTFTPLVNSWSAEAASQLFNELLDNGDKLSDTVLTLNGIQLAKV